MLLSDEDKRQIMHELAQGKVNSHWKVPPVYLENDQDSDRKNYSTFDDFAQRPFGSQWQYLSQFLHLDSDFNQP